VRGTWTTGWGYTADSETPAAGSYRVRDIISGAADATAGHVYGKAIPYAVFVQNASSLMASWTNGSQVATASQASIATNTEPIKFFRSTDDTQVDPNVNSTVDEFRISNMAYSQDWLRQTFHSFDTLFYSTGGEVEGVVVDTNAPDWSGNVTAPSQPVAYQFARQYQFNISWAGSDIDKVLIEHNLSGSLTNYTAFNTTASNFSANITDVAAGVYHWRSIGNDTSNNINATEYFTFSITNATPTVTVSINGSTIAKTYTYPQSIRADGNETTSGDAGSSYILLRNGTQIATGTPAARTEILGNSTWNFTYYTAGSANYSFGSAEVLAQVNRGTQIITLIVNDTTITDNEAINITAYTTAINNEGNTTIYHNITLSAVFANQTPYRLGINSIQISAINVTDGTLIIRANASQSANYSANVTSTDITVTMNNAPYISFVSPNGNGQQVLMTGSAVPLEIRTGETASCHWSSSGNIAYSSMENEWSTSDNKTFNAVIAAIADINTTIYARCSDVSGNSNGFDFPLYFTPVTALGSGQAGNGGGGGSQLIQTLLGTDLKLFVVSPKFIDVLLVANEADTFSFMITNNYQYVGKFEAEADPQLRPFLTFNDTAYIIDKGITRQAFFTAFSKEALANSVTGNITVYLTDTNKNSRIRIGDVGIRLTIVKDKSEFAGKRITGFTSLAGQGRVSEGLGLIISSMGDTVFTGMTAVGTPWSVTRGIVFLAFYLAFAGFYYYEKGKNKITISPVKQILLLSVGLPLIAAILSLVL